MDIKELLAAEKAAKHAARVARCAKAHVKAMRAVYRTAAMLEWEKSAPEREKRDEEFKVAQAVADRLHRWEAVHNVTVGPRPSRPPREAGSSMT